MTSDVIKSRFGRTLEIYSMEWLETVSHAKTVKFDIGQGGLPPEVTWEDKCAAVAMIDSLPARALATMLVWGYSDSQFDIVCEYLADEMIKAFRIDNAKLPQACVHTLPELAGKMARMVLYFMLYDLWDFYTVEGRLVFCGIRIHPRTYSNQLLKYEKRIPPQVYELLDDINWAVYKYKMALNLNNA